MSAMSGPHDGEYAGQANDAAQECRSGWWRTRPWTCRRCPNCLPCPPPVVGRACAAVAAAAARGRPAAGAARPPVRPWPDRDPRAPARFPVPAPAFAAAPHSRSTTARAASRAQIRHDKTHRHAEHEFRIPRALALAPLAAIFPARAQQAPPDMDPVVITAVAPDSPLTFITNPKTPRQPPAGQRRHRLPEDHSRLLGHPQWRHQRRSGAARHVRFAPEHLTNGSSMPGACRGAWTRPAPISRPRPSTSSPSSRDRRPCWGPGASAGTVRFDRDTPRFTEAGVRRRP